MRANYDIYLIFLINYSLFYFSILGVPPDSPQEQIRKHYKKIAVLVHPDKNKQAGAEEAFKVLQRAFELIGEPVRVQENSKKYENIIIVIHL